MILDKVLHKLRTNLIKENIAKDSVVCDLGCGKEVLFLNRLSDKIKYGYGFDIEASYAKLQKIETNKIDFEKDNIILKDGVVDIITMFAVLEHLANPEHIVREAFRVLKANGTFFLTTPSPKAKNILEFLAFRAGIINKKDILEHKRYFKPEEIVGLLKKNGFKEDNIKWRYFELGFNILISAKK